MNIFKNILGDPMVENILKWVEHGLVIGGIAIFGDLGANAANLSTDQTTVLIIGAVAGAVVRFLNKKGNIPPAPPTGMVPSN